MSSQKATASRSNLPSTRAEDGEPSERLVMDLSAIGIPTPTTPLRCGWRVTQFREQASTLATSLFWSAREPGSGEIVVALVDGNVRVNRYVESKEGRTGLEFEGVAVGLVRKL